MEFATKKKRKTNLRLPSFIYFFLATLGLCCCAWAFSSGGEWGLHFVAVGELLIAVTLVAAEHPL